MRKGFLAAGTAVLALGLAGWWYYETNDTKSPQPEKKEVTIANTLENLLEQRLQTFPETLSKNSNYIAADGTRGYAECITEIQSEKFGFTYNINDIIKLKQNDISCDEAEIFAKDIDTENGVNFFISGQYIVDYIEQFIEKNPTKATYERVREAIAYVAIKNSEGHKIFLGGQYLPIFVWAGGSVEYAKNNIEKHPRDMILSSGKWLRRLER